MGLDGNTLIQQLRIGLEQYWPLASAGVVDTKSRIWGLRGPLDLTNHSATRVVGPSNNLPDAAGFASASSQYMEIADTPLLEFHDSLTIQAWVYNTTEPSAAEYITKWNTTGNQREYSLRYTGSTTDLFQQAVSYDGSTATTLVSGPSNPTTGIWYHLVVRMNSQRSSITQNGVISGGTGGLAGRLFNGSAAFRIGAAVNGNFVNGRICHVALWSRVLTNRETLALWNNGIGLNLVRGV